MKKRQLILVAVDIRSVFNVGSLFRICDGFDTALWLVGICPRPRMEIETRLPHIVENTHHKLHKTALGAEETVTWKYLPTFQEAHCKLKKKNFKIIALEKCDGAEPLRNIAQFEKIAIVVGREVEGLSAEELSLCDQVVEIPMLGKKESFNVSVAAAVGLYELRR
jgi:23S rRNA (guanosine2251-2'-O)-methyltransferase